MSDKEKQLLTAFLPSGILDYFSISDVTYNPDNFEIYLEEQNIHPQEYKGQKLSSKGFYQQISIQDYPVRGKAVYLKIKRRRWLNEDTGEIVTRNWELVAKGTRLTQEFAAFLKVLVGYQTSECQ
jgi:hypothetical protein